MRLTVLVKGGTEEVFLINSLVINEASEMLLKSADIYWNYNNINNNIENYVSVDGKKTFFEYGYWTFKDIKKKLKKEGVTLTTHRESGKCEVTCVKRVRLFSLGELLGFRKDAEVFGDASNTSYGMVDINRGLRSVRVSCNAVDMTKNIDQNGKYSDVLASISIPPDRSLKGTTSYYNNINSKVDIKKGSYNCLRFNVSTNMGDNIRIGTVLLEIYITPKNK